MSGQHVPMTPENVLDELDALFANGDPEIFNEYQAGPDGLHVIRRGTIMYDVPALCGRMVMYDQMAGIERPAYEMTLYRQDDGRRELGRWCYPQAVPSQRVPAESDMPMQPYDRHAMALLVITNTLLLPASVESQYGPSSGAA